MTSASAVAHLADSSQGLPEAQVTVKTLIPKARLDSLRETTWFPVLVVAHFFQFFLDTHFSAQNDFGAHFAGGGETNFFSN